MSAPFMVILGAGGHAQVVMDSIESRGDYRVKGFIAPDADVVYRGVATIGSDDDLLLLRSDELAYAAVGMGLMAGSGKARRIAIEVALDAGFSFPPVIDPKAAVAADARIGRGSYVGKSAVVNSAASIGEFSIVNSGAVVEHDCRVGSHVHVACNATLCGNVAVGDEAFVGASAVVIQGVKIGPQAVVGAGSVVLKDVPAGLTVYGVFNGKQ